MAINSYPANDANDNQVTVYNSDDPAQGGGSTLDDLKQEVVKVTASVHSEDEQHSSGDKGTQVLAVRTANPESLADQDNDYQPFGVNPTTGGVYVHLANQLDQTQDGVQAFGNDGNGASPIPVRNNGVADDVAHPEQIVAGADLVNNGDQVINVDVSRAKYVTYTVNETSGGSVDVSVEWLDQNMNTFFTQSASDLSAQGVTQDYSRLNRRGPRVEITVSNNSSATNTNIFVDTLK
jgi:hypothetical protein